MINDRNQGINLLNKIYIVEDRISTEKSPNPIRVKRKLEFSKLRNINEDYKPKALIDITNKNPSLIRKTSSNSKRS